MKKIFTVLLLTLAFSNLAAASDLGQWAKEMAQTPTRYLSDADRISTLEKEVNSLRVKVAQLTAEQQAKKWNDLFVACMLQGESVDNCRVQVTAKITEEANKEAAKQEFQNQN